MSGFHFLRPEWFWAVVPLAFLLAAMLNRSWQKTPWSKVVDAHLLPHLLVGKRDGKPVWPLIFLGGGWILSVVILAGPSWGEKPALKFRSDASPLVAVLDLSHSMEAADVAPTRLAAAKNELRALVKRMPPRPLGLVVYAGTAHAVTPLTEDREILLAMVETLTPDIMPVPGSRLTAALGKAAVLIEVGSWDEADILVFADGADSASAAAAKKLAGQGFAVSVLAIGGENGTIAIDDETVEVPLDRVALAAVARSGGGITVAQQADGADTERLLQWVSRQNAAFARSSEEGHRTWRDDGAWVLLPLLPFAALVFRRGWLALLFLTMLVQPRVGFAFEWDELWMTPDQRGLEALQGGNGERAASLFADPFWKGVALYRSGDLEGALKQFEAMKTAPAQYNRGNILVRQGRLNEALQAYKEALQLKPDYKNAQYNHDLVSEVLNRVTAPSDDKPERPGKAPPEEKEAKKGRDAASKQAPQGGFGKQDQDEKGQKKPVPKEGPQSPGGANDGANKESDNERLEGRSSESGKSVEQKKDGAERRKSSGGGQTARPEEKRQPPQVKKKEGKKPDVMPKEARGKTPGSRALKSDDTQGGGQQGEDAQGQKEDGEGDGGTEKPKSKTAEEKPKEQQAAGLSAEESQALRQWLDRIPDDPGALLREKFKREAERLTSIPRDGPKW